MPVIVCLAEQDGANLDLVRFITPDYPGHFSWFEPDSVMATYKRIMSKVADLARIRSTRNELVRGFLSPGNPLMGVQWRGNK